MEKSKKTARANPESPDLTQQEDILERLLNIELQRLNIAVRIENERNIVFPETTVIIHDIVKLSKTIEDRNNVDNKSEKNTKENKLSKKEATRQIIKKSEKRFNV